MRPHISLVLFSEDIPANKLGSSLRLFQYLRLVLAKNGNSQHLQSAKEQNKYDDGGDTMRYITVNKVGNYLQNNSKERKACECPTEIRKQFQGDETETENGLSCPRDILPSVVSCPTKHPFGTHVVNS